MADHEEQGGNVHRKLTEADYRRRLSEVMSSEYKPSYRPEEDTEANGMVEMQRLFMKLHQRKIAERAKQEKWRQLRLFV